MSQLVSVSDFWSFHLDAQTTKIVYIMDIKNLKQGDPGTVPQLRVLVALPEDTGPVSSPHVK